MNSRTRRNTDKYALTLAYKLARSKSVLVRYGDYLVINMGVENVGNEACADTLNLMRARNAG